MQLVNDAQNAITSLRPIERKIPFVQNVKKRMKMDEQMTKLNSRVTDLHEAYRALLQSVNNLRKEMDDYCRNYEINSVKETIKTDQERVNFVEKKVDEDRQLFTDCIDMHEDQLNKVQAQIIKLQNQIPNLRPVKKPQSFNYRRNFKINDPLIQQYREIVKKLPHVLVNCLEVDVRTCNVLSNARVETIGNLTNWSREELLRVKNCGAKTVDLIEEVLSEFNLRLRIEE